jgi:endonuclease/exonuclease/phosphatase family metal-dependent hydrolase
MGQVASAGRQPAGDPLREWGAVWTLRWRPLSATVRGGGLLVLGSLLACGPSSGGGGAGAGGDAVDGAVVVGEPPPGEAGDLRIVSYNIRHGRGTDDLLDLERTAAALRRLEPDLVGLQEVDRGAERSGGVDQATELGRSLAMTSLFGAFMDYQGGEYGMGMLSRHPVARSWSIPLPEGKEPRVALAAEIVLPGGDTVVAVNVHFDWVDDDGYRFAQASALAAVLDTLSHPWVLLGDLNDEPGSRTLELFQTRALEADKPAGGAFTFSSDDPRKEIDFIFAAPAQGWRVLETRVVDERPTSDHLPVLAVLEWNGGGRR